MAGVVKVVVILRHVGHDGKAVRDLHGDHVPGIQQGGDPQLLLCQLKSLEEQQRKNNDNLKADTHTLAD